MMMGTTMMTTTTMMDTMTIINEAISSSVELLHSYCTEQDLEDLYFTVASRIRLEVNTSESRRQVYLYK